MQEIVGGRYRLDERVGTGGMADVWRAVDRRTGAVVALKRLHPALVADAASRARFEREVAAARAVTHPRLVQLLDAHVADDDAWLAMEYLEGGTLAARMRRGPIDEEAVATIGADVAEGIAALHAAGIVHRDVTPANILLDGSSRARLTDLGIARPDDDVLAVTATGDLVGTFRFMAPEQLAGGAASPASDAWALGAVLYEALARRPPFDVSSPAALLDSQRTPAPALETGDAAIGSLVLRLLDADPAARPSMAEAAATLRAAAPLVDPVDERTLIVKGGVVAMGRADTPAPLAEPPASGSPTPTVRPAHTSRAGSGRVGDRRPIAAALLALLLVVGLVASSGPAHDTGTRVVDGSANPASPAATGPTPTAAPTRAPADGGGGGGGKDKGGKPDHPGKGKGNGNGRGG